MNGLSLFFFLHLPLKYINTVYDIIFQKTFNKTTWQNISRNTSANMKKYCLWYLQLSTLPIEDYFLIKFLCINRSNLSGFTIRKINLLSHVGETMSVFPKQLSRFHSAFKGMNTSSSPWFLLFQRKISIEEIQKSYCSDLLTGLLLFLQVVIVILTYFITSLLPCDGFRVLGKCKLYIRKTYTQTSAVAVLL